MEVIIYVCGAMAAIFALASGVLGALSFKSSCIWTGFASFVFLGLTAACWLQNNEWKEVESRNAKLQFSVAIENALVAEAEKTATLVWFGYGKNDTPTIISPVTDMLYLRLTNGVGAAPMMIDYFSIEARTPGGEWKPAARINLNEGRLFWADPSQGFKSATEVTLDKPELTEAVIDNNIGGGETIKGWAILERPDNYDAEWRISITTITGNTGTTGIAPKAPKPGGDTFGYVGFIIGAQYDLQNAHIKLYSQEHPTR